MFAKPIATLLESVLSDLRRERSPVTYCGFELLVPDAVAIALREIIDAWQQGGDDSYALQHIRRYIAGFGVLNSRFAVCTQPVSPWIFFQASRPIPPAHRLLYYALHRSILIRYSRCRVPMNIINRRQRFARAQLLAERLLQANECA